MGRRLAAVALLATLAAPAFAGAQGQEALGFELTPPRLSFLEGEVSFLRPGAGEWSAAEVNTPLAAGDELYAADDANLEVQIGPRAYLRAGEQTQIGLTSLEPDFLQLRVAEGDVSLDLRTLKASQAFEVDTPRGAFTIERSGYYRVVVTDDATTFVVRRGGRASVTSTRGDTTTVASSEEVVITGTDSPQIETYAAPELDSWDRWNYARTDEQLEAVSARYVPSGVYGVDDLDHYGDWRVVPTYGAIWVPRGVPVGWAPYSTGRWVYDPYYGWSWVDFAPWGWAPYHYGRWVHVSGYWAWAPGPLVVRSYYAPALVAFFGAGGVSLGISVGPPRIGWVALGWGEPIVPWWGPPAWRGVPRWVGWGGPRVVNRVVIQRNVVVHARDIRDYENRHDRNAFFAVDRDHFGRHDARRERFASADPGRFQRIDEFDVKPVRESFSPSSHAGRQPPRSWLDRTVVATREPRRTPAPPQANARDGAGGARHGERERSPAPPVRVVEPARRPKDRTTYERPPFGTRSEAERTAPPPPARYRQRRDRPSGEIGEMPASEPGRRETAAPPSTPANRPAQRPGAGQQPQQHPNVGQPQPPRREQAAQPPRRRDLPGEPANRVYRPRARPSPESAGPPTAHGARNPAGRSGPAANAGRSGRDGGTQRGKDRGRGGQR